MTRPQIYFDFSGYSDLAIGLGEKAARTVPPFSHFQVARARAWVLRPGVFTLGNPHDALFRFIFADTHNAEGLIRRLLPPALRSALARCKITLVPASAIGAHLRQHHADLLFVLEHPDLGQPVLVLLEHKSGRDHRVTRQVLRYIATLGLAWANR
ncbi:MAG: Rpn family recombination-promoting nuclease/putative transposase, partial [Planctomycetota bacterium]